MKKEKKKKKNIIEVVLWFLGLAIGVLAIIMAVLLISLPITNLSELCRYLTAIILFGSGMVIVIDKMKIMLGGETK